MKLFVPGRICLFGEHSDWAGGHRRINAKIERGNTIIAGTNQGIHAEVKPHPTKLIMRSTLPDGGHMGPFEVPMERKALMAEAERGGFFSYAAGVAYQVLTHYRVRGLEIDNYLTDLPVKKGLSSSAALCVLVARAFNRIYDLKMTVRGEMEHAYMGEVTTPSRCGRMDQGCAYGNRAIQMLFDGDRIDVTELKVPQEMYFVIVDLHAAKNTVEILSKLNQCYPFAETEIQRGVQKYLGPVNMQIVRQACDAIARGDAEGLGRLMRESQAQFDKYCQPACPSELTAPVLHKVLSYASLQPFIHGAKGVGSQGDGTAQFICRDAHSQERVVEIIERDLRMSCLKLTLKPSPKVRKALIPAAGFGTRLFPATKVVKKELFPIIDRDGRCKPAILAIIEEAIASGVEEVAIVIQQEDRDLFEDFFSSMPRIENYNKLSKANQEYCQYLMDLGRRVTLLPQTNQEGFGHAVHCAREWVGNEPVLLMLGDHLYTSDSEVPCARQLMDIYDRLGHSVVGLKTTPASDIHLFGVVGGVWSGEEGVLSVTEFAEKPNLEHAQRHLTIDGLPEGNYLTVFGEYILTPKVFDFLDENIRNNVRERGEFQLTNCLDCVRQEEGFAGYVVKGRRFDIGVPDAYRQTVIDFRNA